MKVIEKQTKTKKSYGVQDQLLHTETLNFLRWQGIAEEQQGQRESINHKTETAKIKCIDLVMVKPSQDFGHCSVFI